MRSFEGLAQLGIAHIPVSVVSRFEFRLTVESRLFADAPWKDGSAPSGDAVVAAYKRMALAELLRE